MAEKLLLGNEITKKISGDETKHRKHKVELFLFTKGDFNSLCLFYYY